MSQVYSKRLNKIIFETAEKENTKVKSGVYLQFRGPNFETPAEIRMAKMMGADAVGMSTALEAICARWCGMRVAGISFITNKAAGLSVQTLAHDDVLHAADAKGKLLSVLAARLAEKL